MGQRDRAVERRKLALRASVIYLVAGVLWVLLSDLALYRLVSDPTVIARLETAKGWAFVALSALVVFVITGRLLVSLERSECTMRAVVDSIADGVLLLGRSAAIVDANPAAVRMLRVRDRQALVGVGPEEFSRLFRVSTPDGSLVPPEQYISQRALRGEVVPSYKAVLYPDLDHELVITATAAPVFWGRDDGVDLVVSVMRDQTQIEQLERLRDDLFAAAAHSFKMPLAVIKGHAQLLLARLSDARDRTAAAVIDRQCGKADRLMQNLLVASRLRSSTLRFHPRLLPLAPVALRVAAEMRRATRDHHLIEENDGSSPSVFLDGERLAQAIRNLVELAFERSPSGAEVALLTASTAEQARVGVRSPLPPGHEAEHLADPTDQLFAVPQSGLHAGLRLEWEVSEQLVKLQGGRITRDDAAAGMRTTWIEFPKVAGGSDGRA